MQKFRKITHFLIVLAITSNIVGIHCGRWLWKSTENWRFYCTCLHKLTDYAPLRDLIEQAALELEQNNVTFQCVYKVKSFPEEINDINIKSEVS